MYQRYKVKLVGLTETMAEIHENEQEYYDAHLMYSKAAREYRLANGSHEKHLALCDKAKEMWSLHCKYGD